MNFFKRKIKDTYIFKKFGRIAYIRNGVGVKKIYDDYLYDNCFIEIGFGREKSKYGDWGFGIEYVGYCPLRIIIDKNYIIQNVETESFYNTSSKIDKIAIQLSKKNKNF